MVEYDVVIIRRPSAASPLNLLDIFAGNALKNLVRTGGLCKLLLMIGNSSINNA